MPSSIFLPKEQPKVKPFDSVLLDRTVIAIPLLKLQHSDLRAPRKKHCRTKGIGRPRF